MAFGLRRLTKIHNLWGRTTIGNRKFTTTRLWRSVADVDPVSGEGYPRGWNWYNSYCYRAPEGSGEPNRRWSDPMRSLGGGGSIPPSIAAKYEIHDWRNAVHVVSGGHPGEWRDILDVLDGFVLKKSDVIERGGRKSKISDSLDSAFYARGWEEKEFKTTFLVDDEERHSRTHKIDCYKNLVGLEVEWNSKDQTFVRDLNNFRVLFDLQVLEAGIILTRCDELQQTFDSLGIGGKYGASTTHMGKLLPRLSSGGGGGCPVLVFGIRAALFDPS